MKVFSVAALFMAAVLFSASASATTITLFDDDFGDDSQLAFGNNQNGNGSNWASDGTNLVFDEGTVTGGNRSRFQSASAFAIPAGATSVTLAFNSSTQTVGVGRVNRFEVGLIDSVGINNWSEPLAAENDAGNVSGIVYKHTTNGGANGLVFNDGDGNEQAAVGGVELAGTHDYEIVFTPTTTELFRDGVSLGSTSDFVLDFTSSYHVAGFAQGAESQTPLISNPRSVNSATLTAQVIPEPTAIALSLLGIAGVAARRRR